MLKLLILADDLTGALDTGVKFSALGIETKVVVARDFDFASLDSSTRVLVMDVETRHLASDEAYKIVYEISKKACAANIPHIMKKTDSALRGNVGSELAALYDAAEVHCLSFIPALPGMKRTTQGGVCLIDGVPVNESVFGQDPFDPVRHKFVREIIKEQSDVATVDIPIGAAGSAAADGILICDAITDDDLLETATALHANGALKIMAGCSGLAVALPQVLGMTASNTGGFTKKDRFMVVCGSVNPITGKQLSHAEERGFKRIRLDPGQKLDGDFWSGDAGTEKSREIFEICEGSRFIILDSNDAGDNTPTLDYGTARGLTIDDIREKVAKSMGEVLKALLDRGLTAAFLVTGGDTLMGFMEAIDNHTLNILAEVAPGCVLSELAYGGKTHYIISKSGGFGGEDLLPQIAEKIMKD